MVNDFRSETNSKISDTSPLTDGALQVKYLKVAISAAKSHYFGS